MGQKFCGFTQEIYDTVRAGVAQVQSDAFVRDRMATDKLSLDDAKAAVIRDLQLPTIQAILDKKTEELFAKMLSSKPVNEKVKSAVGKKGPSLKRDIGVGLLVAFLAAALTPLATFFANMWVKDHVKSDSAVNNAAVHYSDVVSSKTSPGQEQVQNSNVGAPAPAGPSSTGDARVPLDR